MSENAFRQVIDEAEASKMAQHDAARKSQEASQARLRAAAQETKAFFDNVFIPKVTEANNVLRDKQAVIDIRQSGALGPTYQCVLHLKKIGGWQSPPYVLQVTENGFFVREHFMPKKPVHGPQSIHLAPDTINHSSDITKLRGSTLDDVDGVTNVIKLMLRDAFK